jgi:predicted rRNA methylase YqxC with S4 and FtsJ domains
MITRLDQALVARGLCSSREQAKRAILAGQVRINRQSATNRVTKCERTTRWNCKPPNVM